MSARIFQAAPRLLRQRQRVLLGSCLGLSVGTGIAMRSSPHIRFDSASSKTSPFSTSSPAFSNAPRKNEDQDKETLNPELMKQLSGGSVAGFLSGLLVSVFSRTLVLLLGVSVVILQAPSDYKRQGTTGEESMLKSANQVAARYGINIIDQLRLKQRLGKSRVLAALEENPVFKLSFGLFFALSAFMQL
ncbi:hypothetical protein E0Z10_g1379 [Xylaria hypoxylon]|uniref:Uncharacterized protein n=1 Tax=Xylaria hypoxylon TaxID=37992 RepID=A0A4Z0ZCM9_9PEZI|nr:hypothetical protein E0Z10_g1379 [Xylaria hypoxylon]